MTVQQSSDMSRFCNISDCLNTSCVEIQLTDASWIGLCQTHIEEIARAAPNQEVHALVFMSYVASGSLELENRIAELEDELKQLEARQADIDMQAMHMQAMIDRIIRQRHSL